MTRILTIVMILMPCIAAAFMTEDSIAVYQRVVGGWPVGDRIAFWAEQFLDTPYDPDPLGVYVREKTIVSDEKVDCMYLTFRVLELALSSTPPGAVEVALEKRFMGRGALEEGRVLNYEDRFAYGEDMIDSGKWGREITGEFGKTEVIRGPGERERVTYVPAGSALKNMDILRNGDIIFFVRSPLKRKADEVIGHIGIITKEKEAVFLIHAGGLKNKGGQVKKVLFADYLKTMPFIGIRATRVDKDNLMPE
ncbi:MAG: DUF1460 domain-containing protein [Nitrospirae bacterium]|nr:DUF1460 domain-containing protein [Nitrospirota bacterium]